MTVAISVDQPVSEGRKGEKYERLIARTKEVAAISMVEVHPCDRTSLEGALDAAKVDIIVPILVAPDLEAGNMLAKSLTFLAGDYAAWRLLGARVPITLTSRADSVQTRVTSCAVAALYAHAHRTGKPIAA